MKLQLLICLLLNIIWLPARQLPGVYMHNLTQSNAVDSFPYRLYLMQNNIEDGIAVMELLHCLDSLHLNGRRIVFNLSTTMLKQIEQEQYTQVTCNNLEASINRGQLFMAYSNVDTYDPVMLKAIGSYWLEHVSHIVADTIAAHPSLAYSHQYRYLIQRLSYAKFAPTLPAESNAEKLISTICEKEWGHLVERFNDRASISIKFTLLVLMFLVLTGIVFTLRTLISLFKK